MTLPQYQRWSKEILDQKDLSIKMQQHERLMYVFVQDVWLDSRDEASGQDKKNIQDKATLMFELQGELVK